MLYGEYDPEVEMRVVREEALKEGKQIIAKNLLEKGSTPEFVREITGLSPEEIEEML
jgi:hypothetical protein